VKPFLTGSHAYGTPHKDSDIDIVMMIDDADLEEVLGENDEFETKGEHSGGNPSYLIGNVNFIVVDKLEYDCWLEATNMMKSSGHKFNKKEATEIIDKCYDKAGITRRR
jgi:hypothetical protein